MSSAMAFRIKRGDEERKRNAGAEAQSDWEMNAALKGHSSTVTPAASIKPTGTVTTAVSIKPAGSIETAALASVASLVLKLGILLGYRPYSPEARDVGRTESAGVDSSG